MRTQGANDVNGSPFSVALQTASLLSHSSPVGVFLLNSSADPAQRLRGCAQGDHERTESSLQV